jgi:alanine racemase
MLTWLELDGTGFLRNVEAFRGILRPETGIMVVVKANAYGHGLRELALLAGRAADWLGVNSVDEANLVAAYKSGKPVAILGHSELESAETIVLNDYRQVVYRRDVAEALSRAAVKLGKTAYVHLKIETGTNRQGIAVDDLEGFVQSIQALPALAFEGAYTHFANIEDTLDPSFAQSQLHRFHQALGILERLNVRPSRIHTAATAGALLYPETGFAMIRLGIGAYGIWPSRETQLAARERGRLIKLTPVLTWKTRIVQIRKVPAGDSVGYGLTYQASRTIRVAVLPIGYYDGYDRKLSNSARVLVRGQFAPVIGRIAMNMTMIDVTDIDAETDDEVVLIGHQGNHEIRAEELAEKSGTIAYEFLSRINPLLPRIVTN